MGKYLKDYQISKYSDEEPKVSKRPKKFKDKEDAKIPPKKKFKRWRDES